MLSSDLSWHFFARENRVYKTWFIYRVLETQFSHDVSIHVEDNWSVGATWKLSLRDSVSNRGFSKIKHLNASHSRTYLSTLCHSLSLSRLSSPLSVILPSHASITLPPSHPLYPLTPPSHCLRHTLSTLSCSRFSSLPKSRLATLSCSLLSHSHSSLTHPLHCQSVSTLKHRLHSSVNSLRYDFVLVWFFHVGLWFLFQSYDWFDCFMCYSVWFPRKCEKNLFGILCWDWCLFL